MPTTLSVIKQEQINSCKQEGENWLDDCEQFVAVSQRLNTVLPKASMEKKKELLIALCSNIYVKDGEVALVYREPFSFIAEFAKQAKPASEQDNWLTDARKYELLQKWLPRLDSNQ